MEVPPHAPVPGGVLASLRDGVAIVAADGGLSPCAGPMAQLLAALGGERGPMRDLGGLGPAPMAALQAGEAVAMPVDGRHWLLRLVRDGSAMALVASDVTAERRAGAAFAELARLRALAAAAATLVHDFGNQLNACLGLAAQVRSHLHDPVELAILRELTAGTQQGAALARTLARLLSGKDLEWATVSALQLVDEAMAVARKAAAQRDVRLTFDVDGEAPVVRTVVTEAVQALWQALMAVVERSPHALLVTLSRCELVSEGGRPRCGARVRIVAQGLVRDAASELLQLVERDRGFLALAARAPLAAGLATAVFVQRRLGGDLMAAQRGDELVVDCLWPAVP